MTTHFKLFRLPIDAAKATAGFVVWPLHFWYTILTNTVDIMLKIAGAHTEDVLVPSNDTNGDNDSIYGLAKTNLDIASMIYYYTELRSETKRLLQKFAHEHEKIDFDFDSDTNPTEECELFRLWDAMKRIQECNEALRSTSASTTEGEEATATVELTASLRELENLRNEFRLNEGDLKVFQTYFDILAQPRNLTSINIDLILYDKYISPQFRFAFGGTQFNRKNIEDMMTNFPITNIHANCHGCGSIYVHHIDDDFTSTSMDVRGLIEGFSAEVVWSIVVNETTRKITVVFRGSANAADWKSNLQTNMVDFNLPFDSEEEANLQEIETMNFGRVHGGFYKYLFHRSKPSVFSNSTKSKGEEIISMLKNDFFNKNKPEYKGYALEVTGHSLGGALSTMFAVRCATAVRTDFAESPPTKITNVSFASPFVGDHAFRAAFLDLEQNCSVRFRHLRISNHQDMVTLLPTTSHLIPKLETYKHVGMNIRLYDGNDLLAPNYRRFYPKSGSFLDGVRNSAHNNLWLGLSVGILGKHLCPEYHKRLTNEDTQTELSNLTLGELYNNPDVTGWVYVE